MIHDGHHVTIERSAPLHLFDKGVFDKGGNIAGKTSGIGFTQSVSAAVNDNGLLNYVMSVCAAAPYSAAGTEPDDRGAEAKSGWINFQRYARHWYSSASCCTASARPVCPR